MTPLIIEALKTRKLIVGDGAAVTSIVRYPVSTYPPSGNVLEIRLWQYRK